MKITLILIIMCISCGSSNKLQGDSQKSLFSLWEDSDGFVLDLREIKLDAVGVLLALFEDGTICSVDLMVTGSTISGTYTTSNDECDIFSDGSYEISDSTLTICNTEGCKAYE